MGARRQRPMVADPLACIFKSGPFAWNGLLVFWLPFGIFASWLMVMVWAMIRAANEAAVRTGA